MSKDVVLHGSKIDWIITEKLEKLREIMDEDATFINLPQLGAESTVITVSGTTLPLIERSIRRMNKLVPPTNTTFLTIDRRLLSIHLHHPPRHKHDPRPTHPARNPRLVHRRRSKLQRQLFRNLRHRQLNPHPPRPPPQKRNPILLTIPLPRAHPLRNGQRTPGIRRRQKIRQSQ
jgi:hypothetical protein